MKKVCANVLLMFLILLIALPLSLERAFADENAKKCVAFGDSITTGYKLGFDNSYANMFANENGFELTNNV